MGVGIEVHGYDCRLSYAYAGGLSLGAINEPPPPPGPCELCLDAGGTWQPEANECSENCNIPDISCYTDSCPAPCSADSCGTCFDSGSCELAGCTWNMEGPAMWCN